jgi:integrase
MGVGVPPRQVLRSLQTKSKSEAVRRFHHVSGIVQAEIETLRRNQEGVRQDKPRTPEDEARYWGDVIAKAQSFEELEQIEAAFDETVERILGNPVGSEHGVNGEERPVYEQENEEQARRLVDIVSKSVVPVGFHFDDFMAEKAPQPKYAYRFKTAVRKLEAWLQDQSNGARIGVRQINRELARRFIRDKRAEGASPATVKGYQSCLGVYWSWLEDKRLVEPDVWINHRVEAGDDEGDKRPFTDNEVKVLLQGPAPLLIKDLMMLAALTGMRRSEITNLKVGNCKGAVFDVQGGKTKAARRRIPIHSDLEEIVTRRCAGKRDDEYLLEGLSSPASRGASGRGSKLGEVFTKYRRKVGVDDRQSGDGQSLVDFHSFRRWFCTKAEQAGIQEHLIASVVGHTRKGMTFGRYSAGPSDAQRRSVVDAVSLPGL